MIQELKPLPPAVSVEDSGFSPTAYEELKGKFREGASALSNNRTAFKKLREIVQQSGMTEELSEEFRALRLSTVKIRTSTKRIHEQVKEDVLKQSRTIDGLKNIITKGAEEIEAECLKGEKYFEELKARQLEEKRDVRRKQVAEYTDTPLSNWELDAEDSFWETIVDGYRKRFERAKAEAEEAERLRIEQENKERVYNERLMELSSYKLIGISIDFLTIDTTEEEYAEGLGVVRAKYDEWTAEQDRLRNEAIRAAAIAEEAERKLADERRKAAIEREKAEARAAKERAEEERKRKKLEEELAKAKAKQEAEERAKAEAEEERIRLEQEEEARKIELSKAPIREQMTVWINSFALGEGSFEENSVSESIRQKFEDFKNWAHKQVKNL